MLSVDTLASLAMAAAWSLVVLMAVLFVVYDTRRRMPEPLLTPAEQAELDRIEAAIEAARRQL